jgi:hypothetical protein
LKLILKTALLLALSASQAAAQEPITRIYEFSAEKIHTWHTWFVPGDGFEARAGRVNSDYPLSGHWGQLNIRTDAVKKGGVKVLADGREVKTKKVSWTGPVDVETTPIVRTHCRSYGRTVNCTSEMDERRRVRVRYLNEVSIMFKPEHFAALAKARAVSVEISGKTYTLVADQLLMLRDVLAASQ